MPKNEVILTDKDREELEPLMHITEAERALMPKEVLHKLELLDKEKKEGDHKELEEIIEESIHLVKSRELEESLYSKLTRSRKKEYLWWDTNYRIFLKKRSFQRTRHKNKINKKQK